MEVQTRPEPPESRPASPEPARPQVSPWRKFLASPASWIIAGLNVAVFLWVESRGRTTDGATLLRFGALERYHVWAGEYWRLVTSMFLHIGPVHLLWNVYAMPSWCAVVERRVGTWRFVLAYFVAGIGASATSLLGHHVLAAGASGAGFGMIGVTLVLAFVGLGSWKAFLADAGVKYSLVMTAIWVALGFTVMPMDNFAHLGGLVFGLAIGWLLAPRSAPRRVVIALWIAFAVLFTGTVVAACYPRDKDFKIETKP
ncbi:MAG TPA: rhomboid family intramembrane serine protease [Planctomycetota bacterium]|jgi:rhomboid protease GluP